MSWLSLLLLLSADPLVIAHRGGAAHWPENSLTAFRAAIAAGVPVIETDAVLTRDNRLALNHDVTNARGPIRAQDFNTLDLPALEDLLPLIAKGKTELMLETKMAADTPVDDFVDRIDTLLRRFKVSKKVILQSFDHRTLAAMHKRNPQVRLCMLNPRTRLEDYVAPARTLGAQIQFINFRIIEKKDVEALHAAGLKVFSGTTSDPTEWRKLRSLGVDAILTDNPLDLMKF